MKFSIEIDGKSGGELTLEEIFRIKDTPGLVIKGNNGKFVTYANFCRHQIIKDEIKKLVDAEKRKLSIVTQGRQPDVGKDTGAISKFSYRSADLDRTVTAPPVPTSASTPQQRGDKDITEIDISNKSLEEVLSLAQRNKVAEGSIRNRERSNSENNQEKTKFELRIADNNKVQFREDPEQHQRFIEHQQIIGEFFRNKSANIHKIPLAPEFERRAPVQIAEHTEDLYAEMVPVVERQKENDTAMAQNISTGTGIKFSDAVKFIKPYTGNKEKCHLFIKDCERAFKQIRLSDKEPLFDYILSQLEGVEQEMIGNRKFKNWEELNAFLNGSYMKLKEVNLAAEVAKFSTLKQGDTEDAQAYFDRAYQFKRRIDAILERPEHNHTPLIEQANSELVRRFVYGLRNPQFRFTLSQELPKSLEDALDQVEKWEFIPGCGAPSRFSNPIKAVFDWKTSCPICETNEHVLIDCPIAKKAMNPDEKNGMQNNRDQNWGNRNNLDRYPRNNNYYRNDNNYRAPRFNNEVPRDMNNPPRRYGEYNNNRQWQNNYSYQRQGQQQAWTPRPRMEGQYNQTRDNRPSYNNNQRQGTDRFGQNFRNNNVNNGNRYISPPANNSYNNNQNRDFQPRPHQQDQGNERNAPMNTRQNQGNMIRSPLVNHVGDGQGSTVRYVAAWINGKKCNLLCDSGAAVSLISSKIADIDIGAYCYGQLRGLGGSAVTLGSATVYVDLGELCLFAKFFVVDPTILGPYDGFIGADILEAQDWDVNLFKGTISGREGMVKIERGLLEEDDTINLCEWENEEKYEEYNDYIDYEEEDQRGEEEQEDEEQGEQEEQEDDYHSDSYDGNYCNFNYDDLFPEELKSDTPLSVGDQDETDKVEQVVSEDEEENEDSEQMGKDDNDQPENQQEIPQEDQGEIQTDDLKSEDVTEEEREAFTTQIKEEFNSVFGDIDPIPSDKIKPYEINLKKGAETFKIKAYRLSPQFEPFIKAELDRLIGKNIVRPSTSPFNSPIWLVPKKGEEGKSTYRMVVDFRRLNQITEIEDYPLPRIDEIIDQLGSAKWFTVMDMVSGYNQIPIRECDRYKTAITVGGARYEFCRLPFGMCNSAANFQRIMNEILGDLIGKAAYCYLDDIVVHGATRQDHDNHLRQVLMRLDEFKLKVKQSKCQFLTKEISFLGHRLTPQGIKMSVEKVNALNELTRPNTVKRLRSFLGMTNYYRKFIKNYGTIATPLYALLKKGEKFIWSEECQHAFEELIRGMNKDAALAFPNFAKEFHLTTDASNVGIGAVLSQEDEEGQQRPIAFISRRLSGAESRYSTTEQECLAIVWAIAQLRHYLVGKEFVIHTDHKPLVWLKNHMDASSRLHRWQTKLQEYQYVIKYKPGKENYVADELSRNFEDDVPTEDKEKEEDILGDIRSLFIGNVEVDEVDNEGDIEEDSDDEELADRKTGDKAEKLTDEQKINGIIEEMHAGRWAGHRGINATEAAIRFHFTFPHMRKRITEFIAKCEPCQRHKHSRENRNLPMTITSTCKEPNEKISYDVIGPFKYPNNQKLYGLTIQDDFSKFTKFCGLEDCTANSIAKALVEDWILCYGIPRELLSDNGANLCGSIMEEVARYFGLARITTSIGHPQANPSCEKSHLRLSEFIRTTTDELEKDTDWSMRLKLASYAFNTTVHSTTGYSPHHLMFGRPPRLISSVHNDNPFLTPENYITELQKIQKELWDTARTRTMKKKERTAERDKEQKPKRRIEDFYVGQKILVKSETLKGKSNRTEPIWLGPFEVAEVSVCSMLVKKRNRLSRINKAHCKPYIEE